jgi:hypothetical protein
MAHDEMKTIRSLDVDLLNDSKVAIYFAEKDDWVGKQREVIIRSIHSGNDHKVKIIHGEKDIPHAFCISALLSVFHLISSLNFLNNRPWRTFSQCVLQMAMRIRAHIEKLLAYKVILLEQKRFQNLMLHYDQC